MQLTAPSTAPPNAPDLVGRPLVAQRFALFAKIAEGGMAGVYRAWDVQLRAWRALKVLLPEYAERANLRTRFESEARALAAIDHPNVVRVFDIAANAPLPYIVMELAEGGSLNDWIERNGQMPARMAVEVALQVARGLGAAHDAGVVHRDVKPQNVLLDARGRCLVTDFGIARVTFVDHLTRTGSSMGTVGYMAPEQRADAKVVDARADVYGLGAMLYKLVTGVVLTDLFLVEHDPKLLAPVPQVLRPVVLKACRHDRELRYQDTRELAEALEGVLEALPPLLDGIPHLGMAPDEPSLDKSSQDFSSIALLFRGPGENRPSAASPPPNSVLSGSQPGNFSVASPGPSPRTPVQLPYRMPERPLMRPDTPVPLPSGMVMDVPRRTAPAAPGREGGPTAPTLDAPVDPVGPRIGARVVLLAGAIAVSIAWFGGALFSGWSLRGDAEAESAARQELYRVLSTEVELLPELVERGAPQDVVSGLSDLYESWASAPEGPARMDLADRYAAGTLRLARERLPAGGADMTSMRARNLGRHHDAWTRARDRWRADADGLFGRSAVALGLGPAPDEASPAAR